MKSLFILFIFPIFLMAQETQVNKKFTVEPEPISIEKSGIEKREPSSLNNPFFRSQLNADFILTAEDSVAPKKVSFSDFKKETFQNTFYQTYTTPDFSNIDKTWNIVLVKAGGKCWK